MENGESPINCIKRKCIEKIGYTVLVNNKICSTETYCIHSAIGYFYPIQAYYVGKLLLEVSVPIEKDHDFLWVEFDKIKSFNLFYTIY